MLRRSIAGGASDSDESTIIRFGLSVNPAGRSLTFNGIKIKLTYSEFEIILLLIKHPGRVFSRKQIMTAARGDDYLVTERAMDVQIVHLRKKLGDAGKFVQTVRGVGYKFDA